MQALRLLKLLRSQPMGQGRRQQSMKLCLFVVAEASWQRQGQLQMPGPSMTLGLVLG